MHGHSAVSKKNILLIHTKNVVVFSCKNQSIFWVGLGVNKLFFLHYATVTIRHIYHTLLEKFIATEITP